MAFLGSFSSGSGGIRSKSERDAAAKRQLTPSSKTTNRSSSSRSTSSKVKAPADLSKYGTGEIRGATKQTRADGSVVYYYEGRVVKEINPKGQSVVRVGISRDDPSRSGRISRISAPVIQQQRALETYDRALDAYNKELRQLEKKRQEDKRKQIRTDMLTGNFFRNTIAADIIGRAAIERLQGPYSDAYKQRLIDNFDLSLVRQQREAGILKDKLRTSSYAGLTDTEKKKLDKITKKIERVEKERAKLSLKTTEIANKVKKALPFKERNYVTKAAKELPAQAVAAFYNLVPALYKTGLEVDAFINLALADPKLLNKQDFKTDALQNFQKTGRVVLESYDPRKPENLFNIVMTVVAFKGLVGAKKAATANKVLNQRMKTAKVTSAKAKVYTDGTKISAVVKGKLQLPKFKYLGKEYPQRTVSFRTTQRLTRQTLESNAFKIQGATKFLAKQAQRQITSGKIKKAYINVEKTVFFKGKGSLKQLKTRTGKGLRKTVVKQEVRIGKQIGSSTKALKLKKLKSSSVISKKKLTGKQLTGKQLQQVVTQLKNLKSSKNVVKFDLTTKLKSLPVKKTSQILKSNLKQINKQLLQSKKLTSAQIKVLRKNLNTTKEIIARFNKELFKSKRGGTGAPFKPKPGQTGAEQYLKSVERDFTKVDSLLKRVEQLDKARKTSIAQKVGLKTKSTSATKALTRNIDLGQVFSGYKLIAQKLVFPKVIPFAVLVGSTSLQSATKAGLLGAAKNNALATSGVASKSLTSSTSGALVKPTVDKASRTVASTTPQPITTAQTMVTNFIASPLVPNRFLPFVGGLPIPATGKAGRVFTMPLRSFLKLEKFRYSADLYSKLYGLKAKGNERERLLRAGRSFTGLEIRKIV